TTAVGIRAGRAHGTVRNCMVRGFAVGIEAQPSPFPAPANLATVIEDNRVDGSTLVGISAQAPGTIVRRNLVTDTGGSSNDWGVAAILGNFDVEIVDNIVDGVSSAPGFLAPVAIDASRGGFVARNRVRGVTGADAVGLALGGTFAGDP